MRYKLRTSQTLPIDRLHAWEFFSSPRNLARITPEKLKFEILSISGSEIMHEGQVIRYNITVFPLVRILWETEIIEVDHLNSFTDIQRKGPYSYWAHRHIFRDAAEGTEMIDELEYAIPWGPFGRLAHTIFVERDVKNIFSYRSQVLEKLFKTKV